MQQQQQAWISYRGRCKRHPHQGLIGVCSLCLKERLLALALELEVDEAEAAAADDEELNYLRALEGAPSAATAAPHPYSASDSSNRRFSASSSHSRTLSHLQHYRNQLHSLQQHRQPAPAPAAAAASRSHIHQHMHHPLHTEKPPASHFTSRKYKSVSSSPRHSSLNARTAMLDHRHASLSPPFAPPAPVSSQPQVVHWRKHPNAVSPLSLSGLNHFISAVKDQRAEEPKQKKKKKSSSLWSLLQKQVPASSGQESVDERRMPKSSLQGSPTHNQGGFKGGGPDSSSMREVHASLCRGDASSLLSSPHRVGLPSGVQPPFCPKTAYHSHAALPQHWRSSTVDDLLAIDKDTSEGDGTSPSWISSFFHRKGRTRSKSISTVCTSSPDLNAVMTASAAAKYGRFSVDAAASVSSRANDISKREARFRRKYASLFEESGHITSSKKRNDSGDGAWMRQGKEGEHCPQCQINVDAQSRRMKLANFLASQANETIDGRAVAKRRADGLPLPPMASPLACSSIKPASPVRKATSAEVACGASSEILQTLCRSNDAASRPLSPGVYRLRNRSRSPNANALVYSSAPQWPAAMAPIVGSKSRAFAKPEGGSTSNAVSPLDTQPTSLSSTVTSVGADGLKSEVEAEKQSSMFPRSRSWSKNWNKAILSPILGFKGKSQHSSSSRKRGAMGSDRARLGASASVPAQYKSAEQELTAEEMRGEPERQGAAAQQDSFLSKDYKAVAEAGSSGGNMSSARVNAAEAAAGPINSGLQISSRHSVDGSCRPSAARAHH